MWLILALSAGSIALSFLLFSFSRHQQENNFKTTVWLQRAAMNGRG